MANTEGFEPPFSAPITDNRLEDETGYVSFIYIESAALIQLS